MSTLESSIRLNDQMSNTLLHIISVMDNTINVVDRMNSALAADADTSSFEAIGRSVERVQEQIRGLVATEIPVPEWQSDTSIEVFNTSGVERYRQEIGSLNDMMSQLAATQDRITQNAVYGNVLPPNAAADMINLNNRIQQIGQRIQEISSRPIDAITPQELNQLEQLRGQLNTALQLQNEMNTAAENMDIEGANSAYLRLSQTVSSTERSIRDNTAEQENFNNTVEQGNSAVDKLKGYIKGAVGAYAGIKGVEKLVEMSDSLVTAKARLDMMSNGNGDETYEQVYQAAQRARGSLGGMAGVVARFGNNAKGAFGSTDEVVAFSELVQKQMNIAGASTQESQNAMLQLSQALGSGVLRGDELNSIFEQAPNLIQGIADYLNVPIGKIREMASEGEITADIVKNSVFAAADDINEKFNAMPMTWGQMWQSMKNQALIALSPLLTRLNEMFNDERFQAGLQALMDGFVIFANIALDVLNAVANAAAWVADNWEVVGPIIMTAVTALLAYKAAALLAKGAQDLLNFSFKHPGFFKFAAGVTAFVATMAVVNNAINDAYDLSWSFGGFLGGTLMTVLGGLGNIVLGIAKTFMGLWGIAKMVAHNIATAFSNLAERIKGFFSKEVELSPQLAAMMELHPDIANNPSAVDNFTEDELQAINDRAEQIAQNRLDAPEPELKLKEYETLPEAWDKEWNKLNFFDLNELWEMGQELGDKFGSLFNSRDSKEYEYDNEFDYSSMLENISDITDNTDDIKNGLEITDEELEYLRDIAEQEAINRFTTAEINIEQTNNNSVSSAMDLDGIVSSLTDMAAEAVEIISEGVHA